MCFGMWIDLFEHPIDWIFILLHGGLAHVAPLRILLYFDDMLLELRPVGPPSFIFRQHEFEQIGELRGVRLLEFVFVGVESLPSYLWKLVAVALILVA